jgi:hypothetical protein
VPRPVKVMDRPREEWTGIPVPAIVTAQTFERVQQRLADKKRFAARNTKVPSLLQGLAACSACGYGYYRPSTAPRTRRSTTTSASAATTTATKAAGSAETSQSAPATWTPSSGTTATTRPQNVTAADLVIQRVEPSPGIGLGRPVQRMLQGTDRISWDAPARSLRGGTSPSGTHRALPRQTLRTDEAAALPSTSRGHRL